MSTLTTPLPADLPENWQASQIVAPNGADVGLSPQHGYNYQSEAINQAQLGVNAALGDIAPIETSPASAAHAYNTFLIYNGGLYHVIASISIGDALTVGTNIASDKIATYLSMIAVLPSQYGYTPVYGMGENLNDNWDFSNPDNIVDQQGGKIVPPGTPWWTSADNVPSSGTSGSGGTAQAYRQITVTGTNSGGVAYVGWVVSGATYYTRAEYAVRGYTGIKYGFDRWINSNTGTVYYDTDGHLRFTSSVSLDQRIPLANLKAGQVYTMSVLTDTGVYSYTKTVGNGQWGTFDFGDTGLKGVLTTQASGYNVATVRVPNNGSFSGYLVAVKLEAGPISTLCHNEGTEANPIWVLNENQNYGEELAKCQWCQSSVYGTSYYSGVTTVGDTTSYVYTFIPTPNTLRITPSLQNGLETASNWTVFSAGKSGITATNVIVYSKNDSGVTLRLTIPSATQFVNLEPVNVLYTGKTRGILDANL